MRKFHVTAIRGPTPSPLVISKTPSSDKSKPLRSRAPLRGFEAYDRVSNEPLDLNDLQDGHFYVTVQKDFPAEPSSPDELDRWDETTFLDVCRGRAIDEERREEYVGTWKLRGKGVREVYSGGTRK